MRATAPVTLVVGAGGLLGSAVSAAAGHRSLVAHVAWGTDRASRDLQDAADRVVDRAAGLCTEWQVCWCAGAGVSGTTAEQVRIEVDTFAVFLDALASHATSGRGTVFMASSAGGIYAGADNPPYDEYDIPSPISPYGYAKLEAEERLRAFGREAGHRVVIGRIANLYGAGQNLVKPQGLISQLCKAQLSGVPLPIYVPMDTVRDYVYVDDCAAMVMELLRLVRRDDLPETLKVLASGHAVTVGALLAECRRVFHRRPLVVPAVSPLSRYQATDLRLRSRRLTQVDRLATTTLGAGVHATYEDQRRSFALDGPAPR